MLEELHVSGLGVIEDAILEFTPGLNVLTGETGTGKTLVAVALSLALGSRGASAMVGPGRRTLRVEARFSLAGSAGTDPEALEWAEDGELILSRSVGADGRSAARVSGRLAPVSTLARLAGDLVEIHGQHQSERLLSSRAQAAFLDRFAGPAHLDTHAEYRSAHAAFRAAAERLRALDRDARERERDRDLLAYQVREIEAAAVIPGELAALQEEESRLTHAEQIIELAGEAGSALGDDGGALDPIRRGSEAGRSIARLDGGASGLAGRLDSLVAEAEDVLAEVRAYVDRIEADPDRLETVRDRVQGIRSLERKYGEGEEGILAYLEEASGRLAALAGSEGERDALAQELNTLGDRVGELAARLTRGRSAAAPRLAEALTLELGNLGMPGATVEVRLVAEAGPGDDGAERVDLAFSGGPGQPVLPLSKVASGGELSRTMLACRTVLSDLDDVPTLVFDEVDAGIGGRAAAAVGDRLAELARGRQVVAVTHLAQIAVRADRHFVVTKAEGVTTVRTVEGEDRVAEVARMLSGSDGDIPLAHARQLLRGDARPGGVQVGAATARVRRAR